MGSKPMRLVSLQQEIRTHTQGKPCEDTEKAAIYLQAEGRGPKRNQTHPYFYFPFLASTTVRKQISNCSGHLVCAICYGRH